MLCQQEDDIFVIYSFAGSSMSMTTTSTAKKMLNWLTGWTVRRRDNLIVSSSPSKSIEEK